MITQRQVTAAATDHVQSWYVNKNREKCGALCSVGHVNFTLCVFEPWCLARSSCGDFSKTLGARRPRKHCFSTLLKCNIKRNKEIGVVEVVPGRKDIFAADMLPSSVVRLKLDRSTVFDSNLSQFHRAASSLQGQSDANRLDICHKHPPTPECISTDAVISHRVVSKD